MKRAHFHLSPSWGVALAFGTAAISGVSIWMNAFAVRTLSDAAVYTTLKNVVAAILLIAAAAAMGGVSEARALSGAQWRRLLAIGLVGGSIPFLLFFIGLAMASAPSAAFIHKTLFVWVALLAVPLLGERLGGTQVIAMAILLFGQIVLVAPRAEGPVGAGELMIVAATVLWAVETILAKRALAGISPALVGAGRLGFGAILLLGFVVVTGKTPVLLTLSGEAAFWILATGVTLAAYVGTWFAALRRAPASTVTGVLVVGAVITATLNLLGGGEVPGPEVLAGLILIVAAASLVAWSTLRDVRGGASGATAQSADRGARPSGRPVRSTR